jgi:hypothetical protein
VIQEAGHGVPATGKAALVFVRRYVFPVGTALAIVREEKTGNVRVGVGVAGPSGEQVLRRRRPALVPAGPQLAYQVSFMTAGDGEVGRGTKRITWLIAAHRLL